MAVQSLETSAPSAERREGISLRVVCLSLALAVFFGFVIPIVDMKMRNTFLGATHLPPGAVAVLLVLLLGINPVLRLVSKKASTRAKVAVIGAVAGVLGFFFHARAYGGDANGVSSLWMLGFWVLVAACAFCFITLALGVRPLSRNESLTVYITCLFSCLTPGHGAENVFVVNLIGPFYYATPENKWLEFLQPYIKPWMTPALRHGSAPYKDNAGARDMIAKWFEASQSGQIPWQAWIVPVVVWCALIFVMYWMMACLCVMLRAQWGEREALAFPLLKLPLEMTEDEDDRDSGSVVGRFFRNPATWVGFGLAVFIQGLNGLSTYNSDIPPFPLSLNTGPLLSDAPWNQIGWTPLEIWPVVVGISYLLTTEISFSFWFFFLFVKAQLIGAYMLGFVPNSMPNAIGGQGGGYKLWTFYQQIGIYFGYVGLIIWTGREHLLHIARRGFGKAAKSPMERDEPISYPAAFWGFIGSFAFIVAASIAAGLTPLLALVMWGLYVVTIIALTRIISEAGLLFVQQGWVPLGMLGQITNAGGNHWLMPDSSLPPAAMLQGSLMVDLRGFVMPSFMQGFKLAFDRKIALRPLLGLMMACSVIGLCLGVYMNIKLGYQQGGLTLDGWYAGDASKQPAYAAKTLMQGVTDASWLNTVWIGLGIALTWIMMAARARFSWFPLHPIGFLVAQSYPMTRIWFSILLGWLCKSLVTRFGGTDTYRKTVPGFLGLALGDVVMMLFWLAIDGWQGKVGHKLMPP